MQTLHAHQLAHEAEEYPAMSVSTTDIRIVPLANGQDVLTDILRDEARWLLAEALKALETSGNRPGLHPAAGSAGSAERAVRARPNTQDARSGEAIPSAPGGVVVWVACGSASGGIHLTTVGL
jgi:hypothetical protein